MSSAIRDRVPAPAARAVVVRHRRPRRLLRAAGPAGGGRSDHLVVGRDRARAAGMRRAEHERAHASRMAQRELLRDHAAERDAVDVRALDLRPRRAPRRRRRPSPRSCRRRCSACDRPTPRLSNVITRNAARQHRDGSPPGPAAQPEAHDQQHRRRPRRCSPSAARPVSSRSITVEQPAGVESWTATASRVRSAKPRGRTERRGDRAARHQPLQLDRGARRASYVSSSRPPSRVTAS